MSKLKEFQAQIQETIEKSIKVVEEQHVALAAKPFDLALKLEKEAKTYSVEKLREKHDQAVDTIYDSVRALNKKVNDFATDLIAKIEGEQKPVEQAAKKAKAAGKKVAKAAEAAAEKVEEAVA
ncbi:MAG: hypothetical protein IPM37_05425 [Hahellaceae bacterium]|nr:hypothetical protein [Hahellaceae bacterium]